MGVRIIILLEIAGAAAYTGAAADDGGDRLSVAEIMVTTIRHAQPMNVFCNSVAPPAVPVTPPAACVPRTARAPLLATQQASEYLVAKDKGRRSYHHHQDATHVWASNSVQQLRQRSVGGLGWQVSDVLSWWLGVSAGISDSCTAHNAGTRVVAPSSHGKRADLSASNARIVSIFSIVRPMSSSPFKRQSSVNKQHPCEVIVAITRKKRILNETARLVQTKTNCRRTGLLIGAAYACGTHRLQS